MEVALSRNADYTELFNAMEKTPAIPAGLTPHVWECLACGRVNPITDAMCGCGRSSHFSATSEIAAASLVEHSQSVCGEVGHDPHAPEAISHQPKRAAYEIAPGLTMGRLCRIFHDKLDYCVVSFDTPNGRKRGRLDEHTDIDAMAQNFMCEVEKALGIYPNTGRPPVE